MKRPLSVWLVQVLLLVVSLLALPGFFAWTVVAFRSLLGPSKLPVDVVLFYLDFAIRIGVLALLLILFLIILLFLLIRFLVAAESRIDHPGVSSAPRLKTVFSKCSVNQSSNSSSWIRWRVA